MVGDKVLTWWLTRWESVGVRTCSANMPLVSLKTKCSPLVQPDSLCSQVRMALAYRLERALADQQDRLDDESRASFNFEEWAPILVYRNMGAKPFQCKMSCVVAIRPFRIMALAIDKASPTFQSSRTR